MRGPLAPPAGARIVGAFSVQERQQIALALSAAIQLP
jgi:hypothetical protein